MILFHEWETKLALKSVDASKYRKIISITSRGRSRCPKSKERGSPLLEVVFAVGGTNVGEICELFSGVSWPDEDLLRITEEFFVLSSPEDIARSDRLSFFEGDSFVLILESPSSRFLFCILLELDKIEGSTKSTKDRLMHLQCWIQSS